MPHCCVLCAVEEAGGKALACVVDVRDEEQIRSAVEQAVAKFGGIEIYEVEVHEVEVYEVEVYEVEVYEVDVYELEIYELEIYWSQIHYI